MAAGEKQKAEMRIVQKAQIFPEKAFICEPLCHPWSSNPSFFGGSEQVYTQ
jgi:hypothetical protein